jgi:ribosomal protein L18E
MPLVRRLPKRGFNSLFGESFQVVNVESLNRFEKDASVGPQELKDAGLVSSAKRPIKILGDGALSKVLTVKAHAVSESARKKIEASGAKFVYLVKPEVVSEARAARAARELAKVIRSKKPEAAKPQEKPVKAEKPGAAKTHEKPVKAEKPGAAKTHEKPVNPVKPEASKEQKIQTQEPAKGHEKAEGQEKKEKP